MLSSQLELKYAKQRKVPIVIVHMQDKWRASEWLGILTAGLLWTPLHDATTLTQNLQGLLEQIKVAVPGTTVVLIDPESSRAAIPAPVAVSGESMEMQSMRGELNSLRADLAQAVTQRSSAEEAKAAAGLILAPMPAEVPPLSLNVQPTPDMHKLKSMLLSGDSGGDSTTAVTSEKSKIGALGMGGIGKTVTASWIARNEDVRQHFELVIWVTLGQTPDLMRMKSLIHLQVTGDELSTDSSPEQAKEIITVAMRGRRILLVLDDVWEETHEAELNFIDTSTASKSLITTRIRGLGGGAQVQLGVPSEEESVKMLLSSAGLTDLSPVRVFLSFYAVFLSFCAVFLSCYAVLCSK